MFKKFFPSKKIVPFMR